MPVPSCELNSIIVQIFSYRILFFFFCFLFIFVFVFVFVFVLCFVTRNFFFNIAIFGKICEVKFTVLA